MTEPRLCANEACGTVLSRFNSGRLCAICEALRAQGRSRTIRPPAVVMAPRPPAPKRPVLEDAVPLPGPILIRPERTIEAPRVRDTPRLKIARTPTAARERARAPGTPQPPRQRANEALGRAFDWDHAAALFQRTGNISAVARHFGVQHTSIRHAIDRVLGRDRVDEILAWATSDARCKRPGCTNAPRLGSLKSCRTSRWFRLCEEHHAEQLEKNRRRSYGGLGATCSHIGCRETPTTRSGRYAGLCAEHAREARYAFQRRVIRSDISSLERDVGQIDVAIAELTLETSELAEDFSRECA